MRRILGRLKTSKAIDVARDWVARYASEDSDFVAAHLLGSITKMSPDEDFPADSDVDLMLVVDGPTTAQDPLGDFFA